MGYMEMAKEQRQTAAARRAMGVEVLLDLDHSVELSSYRGPAENLIEAFSCLTEEGAAWQVALLSPQEACRLVGQIAGVECDLDAVRDLIRWCRRSVGLPEDLIFRVEAEEVPAVGGLLQ